MPCFKTGNASHDASCVAAAISKIVTTLKDTFKVENIAPAHCTGEPSSPH
jgi:hypothetical protein